MLADATGAGLKTADGKPKALAGTFLVAQIDAANSRVRLMDVVERAAVPTTGTFDAVKAKVATYKLVGPDYFYFFVIVMGIGGIVYIFVAMAYKEQTFVRTEEGHAPSQAEVDADAEQP